MKIKVIESIKKWFDKLMSDMEAKNPTVKYLSGTQTKRKDTSE